MKKLTVGLLIALMLVVGAVFTTSTSSHAQYYEYTSPPPNPYAQPWIGPNTPWVYFNGDWFLNGILYYFFGSDYGWAPYYAYPPTYIVRPPDWYAPRWLTWYKSHPVYWQHFQREYPYWRSHRVGERYDERFFEQHHHGQPGAWHQGFHGRPAPAARPEGQRPGAVQQAPPAGHGPAHGQFAPPEGQRPRPGQVTPQERREPGATRQAPTERPAQGPSHVAPPAAHGPAPAQAPPAAHGPAPGQAPPAMQRPAPAPAPKAAPAPKPEKPVPAPGAPPAEKGGQGEEKH